MYAKQLGQASMNTFVKDSWWIQSNQTKADSITHSWRIKHILSQTCTMFRGKLPLDKFKARRQTGTSCNGCIWSRQKGWSEWDIEAWTDASTNNISRNWCTLCSGTKSPLVDAMTSGTPCPPNFKPNQIKSDQTKYLDLSGLRAKHEEVNTRFILHCLQAETETLPVILTSSSFWWHIFTSSTVHIYGSKQAHQRNKSTFQSTLCAKN